MRDEYKVLLVVKQRKENYWTVIDNMECSPSFAVDYLENKFVGCKKNKLVVINDRIKKTLLGD